MAFIGFECAGCGRTPYEECLRRSATFDQGCILPHPTLAMLSEHACRGHARLSVTTCLYCLRKSWIQNNYGYYLDPMSLIQPTYGTSLHAAIEHCALNEWLTELPVELEVTDEEEVFVLHGTADALRPLPDGSYHLIDYKFPSKQKLRTDRSGPTANNGLEGYVMQVRGYAAILNNMGQYRVTQATVLMMPTSLADKDLISSFDVELTDENMAETLDFLRRRASYLNYCYKQDVPPDIDRYCTPYWCPSSVKEICQRLNQEGY